jgi:hypothetical protein
MNEMLYELSPGIVTFLTCSIFVLFTWGGIVFIRPLLRVFLRRQPGLNFILGNYFSIFGLFFGILLGLLSVASYNNKINVENAIIEEATQLNSLFRLASAFHGDSGVKVEKAIQDYNRYIIDEEWPEMRKGRIAYGGDKFVREIMNQLENVDLRTTIDANLHNAAILTAQNFIKLRVARLYSATSGIPGVMWYVVLLGAFLNIILLLLFDIKLITHFLLGGMLSFFIGTVVSLLLILDRPLLGDHGVPPTPYELLSKAWDKELHVLREPTSPGQ